jgi:hypothetical protein
MTTTVTVRVNGRYRAIVKQNKLPPVIVEGNYVGSPNPSGEATFNLPHPASSTFQVSEEEVFYPGSCGDAENKTAQHHSLSADSLTVKKPTLK